MKQNIGNKICFIINPIAGGKNKLYLKDLISKEFGESNGEIRIFFTEYPGHASLIANKFLKSGTETVVAVGGDGTINEVASVMINQKTRLGVIPFGSGNGFARHFGFPLDIKKSLELLKEGNSRKIDVGMVNDHPFFCTTGLGFDAETSYHFAHFGKRGFLSYAYSFFRVFRSYKSSTYKIYLNNTDFQRDVFFINIANISQFGYNFKIAPDASPEDGFLDLVIVNGFPKWKGIQMAVQSLLGRIHRNPYLEYHRAKEIKIIVEENNPHIHIDGEPGSGKKEMVYTIIPESLEVILPYEGSL